MQKTDFHVLELFLQSQSFRSSMHRTTFGASKNTNAVLVQLSNEEIARPDAEKLLSQ